MGTSSTLFNGAFLQLNSSSSDSLIVDAIEAVLGAIGQDQNDVALYPNSFANWNVQPNPVSCPSGLVRTGREHCHSGMRHLDRISVLIVPIQIANFSTITLVDGGETNQNIPIEPLLSPYREVDAIIAIDNSADTTYSWPNGTAIVRPPFRVFQYQDQMPGHLNDVVMSQNRKLIPYNSSTRPTLVPRSWLRIRMSKSECQRFLVLMDSSMEGTIRDQRMFVFASPFAQWTTSGLMRNQFLWL